MIDALREVIARTLPESGTRPRFLLRHGGAGVRDTDQAIVLNDEGRPICAVKSCRGERARSLLRDEHERLARIASTLLVVRPGGAPRPLGFHEFGERAFLVESFVPGRRLKDLDPRENERAGGSVDGVVSWLIDFTRTAGVEEVEEGDYALLVDRPVAQYLDSFGTTPTERALLASIEPRLRTALGGGVPTVVEHGDFADANILVDAGSVAVVDWDEPVGRALPCADLFHFLASIAATQSGLNDPGRMRRGFIDAFFAPTPAAAANRKRVERYRLALELPRETLRPLFALAWVRHALRKLDYLRESGLLHDPDSNYPVTVFSEKRCLNVTWTAELGDAFEL